MGRRNKKNINYKGLREKRRSRRVNIETKRLEKLEKASIRRKLKVSIELRLKKLTYIINLKLQYLGE